MQHIKRLVSLVIVSLLLLLGLASWPGGQSHEVAASTADPAIRCTWDFSSMLADLNGCTLFERRLIYDRLPIAKRRSLWAEHLSSFLHPVSLLTAAQQATVRRTIERLDYYITAPSGAEQAKAALENDGMTASRLRAEFGDSLGKAVFATLGPDERAFGHTVGDHPWNGVPALSSNGNRLIYCSCSQVSDWCCQGTCGPFACTAGGNCGTLFMFECNGVCQ